MTLKSQKCPPKTKAESTKKSVLFFRIEEFWEPNVEGLERY